MLPNRLEVEQLLNGRLIAHPVRQRMRISVDVQPVRADGVTEIDLRSGIRLEVQVSSR